MLIQKQTKENRSFYSNCLLECIKAKLKHPIKTKIHIIPHLEVYSVFPHFWYEFENNAYNFVSDKPRKWQVFWFKGRLEKINLESYYSFVTFCKLRYQSRKNS